MMFMNVLTSAASCLGSSGMQKMASAWVGVALFSSAAFMKAITG